MRGNVWTSCDLNKKTLMGDVVVIISGRKFILEIFHNYVNTVLIKYISVE